jgi:hypothetical protein
VYIQRYCDAIEKVSENKFVCSELAKTVFIEFGILTFFSVVKWSMSFVSFWKNSFCGRFTEKIKVAIFEFSSVTLKKTHSESKPTVYPFTSSLGTELHESAHFSPYLSFGLQCFIDSSSNEG